MAAPRNRKHLSINVFKGKVNVVKIKTHSLHFRALPAVQRTVDSVESADCWLLLVCDRLGFPDAHSLGMRTRRRLTVVNRRQKGVFAPSQNKTKQVEKTPNERTFGRPRRLKVAQKSPASLNGHFEEVTRGIRWTFSRTVNSVVVAAAA